jgi:hypothetical protein
MLKKMLVRRIFYGIFIVDAIIVAGEIICDFVRVSKRAVTLEEI